MLKDLLKKRANNEELTEQELAILKEYDESLVETNSRLKVLEEEKELNKQKYESTNENLQAKLAELAEKEKALNEIVDKNNTLLQLLEDEKSSAAVKQELARIETEKKLMKEKEEKEKAAKAKIQSYEDNFNKLKAELEQMKQQNALMNFKYDVAKKKEEYPYLEAEIQAILDNVESKGLEMSQSILEFLISTKNHEEEMKKYLAKKKAGKSIFEDEGTTISKETKDKPQDPTYAKYDGLNIDLLKKYRFVQR